MSKMNYSNFKEDGYEVIPAETVEVLPSKPPYDLSGSSSNGNAQALANAVSPTAAITNCIDNMLDVVSTISKCVAAVSIERQRTEQVRAAMKAKIADSKEQTERVRIHEKEETKRLIINCEADLKAEKLELEKLREQHKFESRNRKASHKEVMKQLEILEKQTDNIMKSTDSLRHVILNESDSPQIESYLHSLNVANEKLAMIAKEIAALKGIS